ncbi:hypothetical protein IGI04_039195 [Brassica rapa subsp. trilocularis]|uniref:Uncharacterized protein n=2 Tax=Brassica campestris TaxID=3711 RepID=A0A3P6D1M2_BRACM|nr:hypothetical protein IGI04_039195 [Brassica rapa subsp. trilocularis]CAG7908821.1 unnamed protein product [Brassica rapa]VDD16631.1 unnamed protein product [Brassica rapa]
MGAAEARALWQRTAAGRCFAVREDFLMAPRLTSCHHQRSSSGNTEKSSYYSRSFGDFFCDTKWWLKGSSGFDEEIANTFFEDDTKCKKLHDLVDLIGKREQEDVEYSFISKKDTTTPWWRSITDIDELALLVATRSLDYNIQNCDLPPPQKLHKRIHCTSGEKGFISPQWKQGAWSDRFESSLSHSSSTASKNKSPKSPPMSDDLSNAQLLEALRHSQTRAREAEKVAREACAEKERVMTIFLRHASHLLAYKQWVKLLEMEVICRQMKKGELEEPEHIKGVNLKKRKQRVKKKMGEIGRYMMAFALGFSLIGAGLFLGWTVGWLFPF